MEKWIAFDEFSDKFCWKIKEQFYEKYQSGIKKNLKTWLQEKYPSLIACRNGQLEVDKKLTNNTFGVAVGKEYFKKEKQDFTVMDFAYNAYNPLRYLGALPIENMSVESMEKRIRNIFDSPKYIDQVYVKLTEDGKSVTCLSSALLNEIISHKEVHELIEKQKAKNYPITPIQAKRTDLEKARIELLDSLEQDGNEPVDDVPLTKEDKLYYMVQALFSLFFTDFDFASLEADINEFEALDGAKDFGERYQYLNDLLTSPNFNWKYYSKKTENVFLDNLAEKIAEKLS